jgi:RNA polymerase sigma factor (TIGR02999 family)
MADSVEALLEELARGSDGALDRLVPLVYEQLRALAHAQRRRLHPDQPLDTTELVHETYLKLGKGRLPARDAGHLLALLARLMRQVLVDAARHRAAMKRGGAEPPDLFDEQLYAAQSGLFGADRADEVLAVEAALGKLRDLDERLVQVVECRFYSGLTEEETGAALGLSARTVHRDWLRARAWLRRELARASASTQESEQGTAAGEAGQGELDHRRGERRR